MQRLVQIERAEVRNALVSAHAWGRLGLVDASATMREAAAHQIVGLIAGDDIPDGRQIALRF